VGRRSRLLGMGNQTLMHRCVVRLLTDICSLDIAVAVGQILDACTHEVVPYGMKASGEKLANGNPNISVHAVSTYDG
jgi:hypothetical protein